MAAPAISMVPSALAWALRYAERGWPVFPVHGLKDGKCSCGRHCKTPGKHPAIQKGHNAATTDTETIRKWWRKHPERNIGIRTGAESGLVVIDIDPRHGGDATLSDAVSENDDLPDTLTANTGGGGFHLFFRHPGGKVKTSTNVLGEGVDVRGDGGYIVAAPSRHTSGGVYSWRDFGIAPAPIPEWLLDRLTAPVSRPHDACEPIPVGRRNDTLASIAGRLHRDGLKAHRIETHLLEENYLRCAPPLDPEEIRRIVASITSREINVSTKTKWQNAILGLAQFSYLERIILMTLGTYMNADGRECYPSQDEVAHKINCSRTKVNQTLAKAVNTGWLSRYLRPRPKHERGKQKWSYGYIAKFGCPDSEHHTPFGCSDLEQKRSKSEPKYSNDH